MESHIRIKFNANLNAIQSLDCASYKVLMYLAGRSNQYGTCFPYGVTIAKDTNLDTDTVYPALGLLEASGYIKTLRKAFYNRFSKESTPPLFQVSPHFLEIAEEYQNDALAIWNENGKPIFSASNQQQEPTAIKNTNNQPQETTTTTNTSDSLNEKPRKANREKQTASEPTKQAPQVQSSLPNESSAIVKKATNPKPVKNFLQDGEELLAERLFVMGIKLNLARGFIVEYGYAKCLAAVNYTDNVVANQGDIRNPSGFFRAMLQSDIISAHLETNYFDQSTYEIDDI